MIRNRQRGPKRATRAAGRHPAWRSGAVALILGAAAACGRDDAAGGRDTARAAQAAPHAAVATESSAATAVGPAVAVTVYKSPSCGCCTAWVDHMKAAGFAVTTVDQEDVTPVKTQHGVGDSLASCHTALVEAGDGARYVVEGHVPAADVRRLLRERPAVLGIAAPGMPGGSPGMEMPGVPADRYDVVSFTRDGATQVFARH